MIYQSLLCVIRALQRGCLYVLLGLLFLGGCSGPAPLTGVDSPKLTHGVAASVNEQGAAILWARADRAGTLQFRIRAGTYDEFGGGDADSGRVAVDAESDFTGKWLISGLRPGTEYVYIVRARDPASGLESLPVTGRFIFPPSPASRRAVSFAWGLPRCRRGLPHLRRNHPSRAGYVYRRGRHDLCR